MTVIWSSPPMVARMARISGSANAALMSAARSFGLASSCRVVGYSTGTGPVIWVSRFMACLCTAGATPGAANDGDSTATLSPRPAFGGAMRLEIMDHPTSSNLPSANSFAAVLLRSRRNGRGHLTSIGRTFSQAPPEQVPEQGRSTLQTPCSAATG